MEPECAVSQNALETQPSKPLTLAADHPSSFDGLMSTSNHLVSEEKEVCIHTSKPIWWTAELKSSGLE